MNGHFVLTPHARAQEQSWPYAWQLVIDDHVRYKLALWQAVNQFCRSQWGEPGQSYAPVVYGWFFVNQADAVQVLLQFG